MTQGIEQAREQVIASARQLVQVHPNFVDLKEVLEEFDATDADFNTGRIIWIARKVVQAHPEHEDLSNALQSFDALTAVTGSGTLTLLSGGLGPK
jgi:hypothetical protein